jgi:hypothetical protein
MSGRDINKNKLIYIYINSERIQTLPNPHFTYRRAAATHSSTPALHCASTSVSTAVVMLACAAEPGCGNGTFRCRGCPRTRALCGAVDTTNVTIVDTGTGWAKNKKRSNQINQRSRNMFRVFAALVRPRGCFHYDHYYHHTGCGNRTGVGNKEQSHRGEKKAIKSIRGAGTCFGFSRR